MKRSIFGWMFAALLLCSLPALAQDGQDHRQWIVDAKAELHSKGVQTENVGPCGPFQIINLAAYRHKETGLGVLDKPNGNHCEWPAGSGHFYSVDYLVYPNGAGGDMLIASEVENGPTWSIGAPDPAMVSRWRAPIAPGNDVPPPPPPPDLSGRVAALEARAQAAETRATKADERATAADARLAALAGQVDTVASQIGALGAQVQALAAKPVPVSCSASLNLGATRIPLSCRLQ